MNKKDYEILNFLETQKKCRVPEVVLISSGPLRINSMIVHSLDLLVIKVWSCTVCSQLVGSHDFVF